MATPEAVAQACKVPPRSPWLSDEEAGLVASTFTALADPARVKVVHRLLDANGEPVCVCDFVELLDLSQPAVSYHLKVLREAGLVERERRGSFAHYKLREDATEWLSTALSAPSAASVTGDAP